MVDLKYIGHSAFELKTGGKTILIDPLLSVNPKYDWKSRDITDIFLTHGHSDHLGNAIEVSKEKNATITAIFELANYCSEQGATTRPVGMGAWLTYDWGRAVFVPAFHSSSLPDGKYAGNAAGIVFDIEGVRIYHAGDTALTSEMKTIKELYSPSVALLPVGGNYTMDVEHAAMAAKWLEAKTVIPMHYGTFPEIAADVERFHNLVQSTNVNCAVLNPEEI